MPIDIVLLGAGGFAREVEQVAKRVAYGLSDYVQIKGMLSDDKDTWGQMVGSTSVLGDIETFHKLNKDARKVLFIAAVGSPALKKKLVERVAKYNGTFSTITSFSASVGERNRLGAGVVICPNASITCDVTLGDHVAVNLNCTIGHDTVIGNYCTLAPGTLVSGKVTMGEGVETGTGAIILPGLTIGDGAVIGAGAVVTKDVPPGETWIGVPARSIKGAI